MIGVRSIAERGMMKDERFVRSFDLRFRLTSLSLKAEHERAESTL